MVQYDIIWMSVHGRLPSPLAPCLSVRTYSPESSSALGHRGTLRCTSGGQLSPVRRGFAPTQTTASTKKATPPPLLPPRHARADPCTSAATSFTHITSWVSCGFAHANLATAAHRPFSKRACGTATGYPHSGQTKTVGRKNTASNPRSCAPEPTALPLHYTRYSLTLGSLIVRGP